MNKTLSRRQLVAGATALVAAPAFIGRAVAEAATFRLRCSLDTPPSHTRNRSVRDYLDRVEAASQGRITSQVFDSGQLFPDLDIGKAMIQNQVEMGVPGNWALTSLIPDADFFQHPTLYGRSIDELRKVVAGPAGKLLDTQLEQKLRVHVLGGWLELGFDNWYSASKPVGAIADLRTMKIRIPGGAGMAWRCQFVGAIPNTTALPNVPLALSQGALDGLIATDETISSMKLWEARVKYSLADHQCMGQYIPVINGQFWNGLPDDLRAIMTRTWAENLPRYLSDMAAAQLKAKETMQANGVEVIELPPQDVVAERGRMEADAPALLKATRISPAMAQAVTSTIA